MHYLAAEILRLPVHGERVAGLIARRFPVILVDELQDTGWFLGQSLVQLLRRTDVRGMTVGDPDQAIYEFSGADPGLFETVRNLDGAQEYPIETTRRCSARISRVATALSSVNRHVTAREGAPAGHVVLLVHDDDSPQGDGIIAQRVIELQRAGVDIMILARTNNLVSRFRQEDESSSPELKAGTRNLHRAALALRAGKSHDAVGIVATLLSKLVLGGSSPTLVVLRNHGIEPRDWRRSIWRVLQVSIGTDDQSWGTWRDHIKAAVGTEAERLGPGVSNQVLGSNFQIPLAVTSTPRPSMTAVEESASSRCPADTVHGAKGREFDVVVLYVQKPHAQHAPCPSTAWWDNPEARRVAFVAATRARNTLVVCVHRQTYDRLVRNRADFVSLFDIVEEV